MSDNEEEEDIVLEGLPTKSELNSIKPVSPESKFLPDGMVECIGLGLNTFLDQSLQTDETRINYVDRYIVYDAEPNLTIEVWQYIVYWLRRYTNWDENYYATMSDAEAEKKVKEFNILAKIMEPTQTDHYAESLYEDRYYMARYLPKTKHATRLMWLSFKFDIEFHKIVARDMDIRIRRDRFLDKDRSIRSAYGRDYIYLRYCIDAELGLCDGGIFNIGSVCLYCLSEKNLSVCSNCKEASYCCREHQKKDWSSHKILCKQQL